jgi:hypothetical protein
MMGNGTAGLRAIKDQGGNLTPPTPLLMEIEHKLTALAQEAEVLNPVVQHKPKLASAFRTATESTSLANQVQRLLAILSDGVGVPEGVSAQEISPGHPR